MADEWEISRRLVGGEWVTDARLEPGGGSSDSPIELGSTNLSSAQLLDLHNTPVELLPAPGGRNYYVVQNMVLHYRFVTTPYNEGGANIGNSFAVFWGTSNPASPNAPEDYFKPISQGGSPVDTRDLFTNTEDAYVYALPEVAVLFTYGWLAATIENQPISVGFLPTFAASLTGGDSTLTIRTVYSIIDGAP